MINNKVEEIKVHVQAISDILGIKKTAGNENTPLRVAKMFVDELFVNLNDYNINDLDNRMKVFALEADDGEPITLDKIPFYSMCEHHFLPMHGTVKVSYVPSDCIIGLSKIPRVVEYFSRRPQLQERYTQDIGNYLYDILKPKNIKVEVTAQHMCVSMRGAKSELVTITTFEKSLG